VEEKQEQNFMRRAKRAGITTFTQMILASIRGRLPEGVEVCEDGVYSYHT
jgi:hypothetical protein